jgi:capsular polysaccharide biosynthesis protein
MTLQEIFQRIIRAHLLLIGICALVPVVLVVGLAQRQSAPYTGSVRIQVNSSAPASTTEADALSSRVLALATTPTLVEKALQQANIDLSASNVAQHHVTATRLGESPVVDVAVTLPSKQEARALSAALVEQVVAFINQGSRPALDDQIASLDKQVTAIQDQRNGMMDHLAGAGRVGRQILGVRIQSLNNQLTELQAERSTLLATKLSTDEAVVIDGDNPEVVQAGSGIVPRAALGMVLGLLLGLAIAVLIETLSPRVAGIRALSRTLSAPVLGRTNESPADLAASMRMAARRQGVETVVLMGVEEKDAAAATTLLTILPAAGRESRTMARPPLKVRNGPRQPTADPFQTVDVEFSSLAGLRVSAERTAGVVVVSNGTCRVRDLDQLRDRVTALRWPVVGILELTRSGLSNPVPAAGGYDGNGTPFGSDDLVDAESSGMSREGGKPSAR